MFRFSPILKKTIPVINNATSQLRQKAQTVGKDVGTKISHDLAGTTIFSQTKTLTSELAKLPNGTASMKTVGILVGITATSMKAGITITNKNDENSESLKNLSKFADGLSVGSALLTGGIFKAIEKTITIALAGEGKSKSKKMGLPELLKENTNNVMKYLNEMKFEKDMLHKFN